jgi:hypothetical protein
MEREREHKYLKQIINLLLNCPSKITGKCKYTHIVINITLKVSGPATCHGGAWGG